MQPDFIAEVPGIEVQGDYDMIIGSKPDVGSDKEMPSFAQRTAEASENYGRNLEANTQVKARGVDISSSDGSVIDLSGDDDEPDVGVYHVKQEPVIIEETFNNKEGDDAPSLVYGNDSNSSDNEDDDPPPTGRGHRVRVTLKKYTPTHSLSLLLVKVRINARLDMFPHLGTQQAPYCSLVENSPSCVTSLQEENPY